VIARHAFAAKMPYETEKTVGQIVATWCPTSNTSASERLSHQMILRQTQHQLEAKKFAKSAPSQVPKMII